MVFAYAAGGGMLILAGLTANEVVLRYFFNAPTIWTLEISEYLLSFCVYFGMAYSLQKEAHVSVPLIYSRFNKQTQWVLDMVGSVLLLVFWLLLFFVTLVIDIDYLTRNVKSETILATPLFYPMLLIVIGSLASCLQAIFGIHDKFIGSSDKVLGETS
jgi:TRAP-type C4-dicarboxylate transport system permease small subunit